MRKTGAEVGIVRRASWLCFVLTASIIGCLCEPTTTLASTWYVRADGGDITQCNGLVDAPYTGGGTGQPCAVNHLFWLFPPPLKTPLIAGGDTVIIGPGQYMMGMNAIGDAAPNTGSCQGGTGTFTCMMAAIPSGPDADHPTRIIGKNWDTKSTPPPELWGAGRIDHIISLVGSNNVVLQYLDITDHAQCGYNFISNSSLMCNRTVAPYGYQADYGIYATDSSNILLKDVKLHGLASGALHAGRLTNWTLDNVSMHGNAFNGWNGDVGHGAYGSGADSSMNGTIVMTNSKVNYNGCVENYPLTGIYPDIVTGGCYSQGQGGYGDGLGMYFTEGNWIFQDSEFMHNTQDGIDMLYHTGQAGTITFKRIRAEGNAGQQLKTGASATIENSVIVGNCNFFYNNPIATQLGFSHCRAAGTPISTAGWRSGHYVTMTNSTIIGPNKIFIEAGSGSSASNAAGTGSVVGSLSSIVYDNQFAVNKVEDTIWIRWSGNYNPNYGHVIVRWNNYASKATLSGTWIYDGNGIYHLTGVGAQTGGVYSFNDVVKAYICDGTEKFISRNNIFLGMEWWSGSIKAYVQGTYPDLFYLNGWDGNGTGSCAAINPVTFDNRDGIVYNTKSKQCPNNNNIFCQDPQLTAIPPLFGAADIYTYGEKWNVMPRELSPAVGVRSSLPGSTVLGDIVVPTNDYLGFGRPSDSITWGPLEFNKIPFAVLINDPVSPTNRSTQTISGSLTGSAAGASVTVRVGSAEPVAVPLAGASWSLDLTGLVPGKNQILVTAADASGNSVMATTSIVVDADPPSLLIVNPVQDFRTDQNSLLVEGKISDATTVKVSISVDGITYNPIVTNGTFKQNITFAVKNALHQLIIKAADSAGNQATIQRNVLYAEIPDGDIDGNGIVEFNDAIQALRIASGLLESDLSSLIRGNVAPIINGKPAPSGKISIQDVLVILRKYLGLISF